MWQFGAVLAFLDGLFKAVVGPQYGSNGGQSSGPVMPRRRTEERCRCGELPNRMMPSVPMCSGAVTA